MKPSPPSLSLSQCLSQCSMLEQEKDWTGLPPELIQIITKKLPDLLDFTRFRATCKAWRSSAPLSDPPPQLPWFLELPVKEFDGNCHPAKPLRFYSVSSCQTLTIRLTNNRWWLEGAFSHYLPFRDFCKGTLPFFNPLTKDQFSLPWPMDGPNHPWMVWTGTDPIRNRSIAILGWEGSACYDPHSNKWVEQQGMFSNSCYWQGMFFTTDVGSRTKVFEASSKKLLHNIPPPEDDLTKSVEFRCPLRKSYLVESLGIILRVSWLYDIQQEEIVEDFYDVMQQEEIVENYIFDIYRLEFDGLDGQPCWVRVHNIGNQILFLQDNTGFSMTATPSTGFREGCIYFIQRFKDKPYVYDILAGTIERIPSPFNRCTWFLPGLC